MDSTDGLTLDQIDLTDLDRFGESFPHEWFTLLRRTEPVWWHEPRPGHEDQCDGEGFWVLTRHDDVTFVHRRWQLFSSQTGPGREDRGGIALTDQGPEDGVGTMMLMLDPPAHTRLRKLVNSGFTPRSVTRLEDQMRARTSEILDALRGRATGDFVVDVAAELPLQAIAELVGVPQEDRHRLFEWTNRMIGSQDPEFAAGDQEESLAARAELFGYAHQLGELKRRQPGDDIWTRLLDAEVTMEDGTTHRLEELELDLFFMLLTVAGNETTRNAITHGLVAFCENPDQWRLVQRDRSLLPSAIEEVLRWASPVVYFRRTATEDITLRGREIRAGQKVTVWYPSANRDEAVFDDPFRFDVTRDPNPHLAFGAGGPHFCLGAHLARLEIKVMFDELLDRHPDIAMAGPPERLRMNLINGIKHLPVRYGDPAPA